MVGGSIVSWNDICIYACISAWKRGERKRKRECVCVLNCPVNCIFVDNDRKVWKPPYYLLLCNKLSHKLASNNKHLLCHSFFELETWEELRWGSCSGSLTRLLSDISRSCGLPWGPSGANGSTGCQHPRFLTDWGLRGSVAHSRGLHRAAYVSLRPGSPLPPERVVREDPRGKPQSFVT